MSQPLKIGFTGSVTPDLEGAPSSQMHDFRTANSVSADVAIPTTANAKGPEYETVMDTSGETL